MLNYDTKRSIDAARQVLVGQVPDPKGQVEQITMALLYKFMDALDRKSISNGGKASFFVGGYKSLAWSELMSEALDAEQRLALYRKGVEGMSENKALPETFRSIFKGAFLSFNDPRTLRLFLAEVDGIQYGHSEDLGDAFEYLLSVLGSQGDAGQFRTPRHIIDFIVEVVSPKKNERILDPACGTAGFLISAQKHIYRENSSSGKIPGSKLTPGEKTKLARNIVGYDISPDMVRLSLANMYLHGLKQPQVKEYDTLTSDAFWESDFDVILANPPFMTPKGGISPHKRFMVNAKRSEVLFVDYIAEHLTLKGRAGIIVPEGIVFQSGNAYKSLRKNLIENWGLCAVVSLPAGVFKPYSGVKTSILFIDKELAEKTDEILFVKVENDGFDLGDKRGKIEKNDLPEAARQVKAFFDAVKNDAVRGLEVATGALVVGKEKINESADWNLNGELYREVEAIQQSDYPIVELSKVCDIQKGTSITKKQTKAGDVPVIAGGQNPAYFHNLSNRDGDIVTVSGSGAYAGFVNFFSIPIFASDCSTVKAKSGTGETKFIYYLLKEKQEKIYALRKGMAQPHVYPKDLKRFKVPFPPSAIQRQIIAEINAYQKVIDGARQVVENYTPRISIDSAWPVVALGEVATVSAGNSAPQDKNLFQDGIYPFCRTADVGKVHISSNFTEISDHLNEQGISGLKLFKKGTILFPKSGASTFLNHRAMLGRDSYVSSHLATINADKQKIKEQFLFYLLCEVNAKTITAEQNYPSLRLSEIAKIKVSLPPLKTQRQIVAEIKEEEKLINANKTLIRTFERKIKAKIAAVWG